MIPGETLETGAPKTCDNCGVTVKEEVLKSPAGFYIGTQCNCGPYSRESIYIAEREIAEKVLAGWSREEVRDLYLR